jgi:hypothetical protein
MADTAAIQDVPAGTANGTPLPNPAPNVGGVIFYIPAAGSVSYSVASSQPGSAPDVAVVAGSVSGGATLIYVEPLAPGQNCYVTALTGLCKFRWHSGG